MQTPQIFNFEQNEVRTILIKDTPHFVANDVAKALGYKNPSKATKDHCKKPTFTRGNDSLGRPQGFKVIPESDVYRLVIKSNLPNAEQFEEWVMEEVLPSIRKTGAYLTDQKANDIIHGNGLADLLIQAGEQIKTLELEKQELTAELEEVKEKTTYLDLILESTDDILTTQIAQDYGFSAIRFNNILRDLRIQRKVNNQWVLYKKYMGKGYIGSRTHYFQGKDGKERTTINTTWKQKGRRFLYEILKKNGYLPLVEQEESVS